jgi:hypothetical protein
MHNPGHLDVFGGVKKWRRHYDVSQMPVAIAAVAATA